jgi:hypothetical protein
MRIGRKEALIAFVAGIVPWMSRAASGQVISRVPVREPTAVSPPAAPVQTVQLADLQRRIAALETQLANQVAFTKDAAGNLSLRGSANVTVDVNANLSIRAGSNAVFESANVVTVKGQGQAILSGGGNTKITGATIALN